MTIQIEILEGAETLPYISQIATLQYDCLREFPFLRVGNVELNIAGLKYQITLPDSTIVIARRGEEIMGALTGYPLISATFQKKVHTAFAKKEIDPQNFYHVDTAVIHHQYRKQFTSLFYKLILELIRWSNKKPIYKNACLFTVSRYQNHPLKPKGYKDNIDLFGRLGFEKFEKMFYRSPTILSNGNVKKLKCCATILTSPIEHVMTTLGLNSKKQEIVCP